MSNYKMSSIEKEDIKDLVSRSEIEWEKFRGKTIAVTGATGLLGKSIIFTLLEANRYYELNGKIIAFVRNIEKANKIFGEQDNEILWFVEQDVQESVSEHVFADYLIHAASITTSRMMIENPVETIMTTIEGTKNMLNFAEQCKMEGVVYLSSMEAYGIFDENHGEIRENELGYIDLTNVRSGYPESKRLAECLCASYSREYGVKVRVARLAQTFGAGIFETENRVFAQFAKSVLRGEDIVLHTKGEKANCYCYTSDAVAGILLLLTKGEDGQIYNIANMNTFCSIRELAEFFLMHNLNEKSKLCIEIPENSESLGYAPSNILKLNSEKIMELGWRPKYDMYDMTYRLLESMR